MTFPASRTHENLKAAFAGESQANRRYIYMSQIAEKEGLPEVAALFKHSADGETGHALKQLANLESAVAGETYEYTDMYPAFAAVAREEGFNDIAAWFETLAKVERFHAGRFQDALDALKKREVA